MTLTKIVLKLFSKVFQICLILTVFVLFGKTVLGQDTPDSLLVVPVDTLVVVDSTQSDSLSVASFDTLAVGDSTLADSVPDVQAPKEQVIDDPVDYSCQDSMQLSVSGQQAFLYGDAKVNYQDIELTADYIEFDMGNQQIFAQGVPDSNGVLQGSPVFTQGGETFEADSLGYNFNSGKGVIYGVKTAQGEGYLHGVKIKRNKEGHVHVKDGKYTTCDADHPHFYLSLTKAVVIPEDKIVAGPSYIVMEDIPVPIGLPFGFFPNTRNRASGIIIPRYGQELTRGFYLRDGGWYQVLGDHADLRVIGNVYSKGSWGVNLSSNYRLRYKFAGNLAFRYNINKNNEITEGPVQKDYSIIWSHRQDAKANPTQTFSASVNFSSQKYDQYNSYNSQDYLTNTKSSSINYTKNWRGKQNFRLSLSGLATQSTSTGKVKLELPKGSFSVDRIYPFRSKESVGKKKWYEDIGFQYSSQFQNVIDTYDSLLFTGGTVETPNFAYKHDIPFFINIKTGKLFTISPSLNYNGRLYNSYIEKTYINADSIHIDTVNAFTYAHAINPSIGVSFTPKFYGMYSSKKEDGYISAVRHVMSPRVSASYTPDMNSFNDQLNYMDIYRPIANLPDSIEKAEYSIYEGKAYGTPSSNGRSASVNFSLSNNLEMKVRPKNDTTGELQKVSIIDNLDFSTRYSPFATTKKWGDVSMRASTKIYKKKLGITFNGTFSPYDTSGGGAQYLIHTKKKLLRMTRLSANLDLSLRSKQGGDGEEDPNLDQPIEDNTYQDPMNPEYEFTPGYSMGQYVDFSIPWTLTMRYRWDLSQPSYKRTIKQTFEVSGDFSLTPKWKIGYRSGYDFNAKEITFTNINVHRDLHCWEMQFTMVPFGPRRSYSFTIRAKSTLLRDLKVDKKADWYDNF